MKKIMIVVGIAAGTCVLVIGALNLKVALAKPASLIACKDQVSDSFIVVRKGCEPGQENNLKSIANLLQRLPDELQKRR
jgi:hypothetical protein